LSIEIDDIWDLRGWGRPMEISAVVCTGDGVGEHANGEKAGA